MSLVCGIVEHAVHDLSVNCSAWAPIAGHNTSTVASMRTMVAIMALFPSSKSARTTLPDRSGGGNSSRIGERCTPLSTRPHLTLVPLHRRLVQSCDVADALMCEVI